MMNDTFKQGIVKNELLSSKLKIAYVSQYLLYKTNNAGKTNIVFYDKRNSVRGGYNTIYIPSAVFSLYIREKADINDIITLAIHEKPLDKSFVIRINSQCNEFEEIRKENLFHFEIYDLVFNKLNSNIISKPIQLLQDYNNTICLIEYHEPIVKRISQFYNIMANEDIKQFQYLKNNRIFQIYERVFDLPITEQIAFMNGLKFYEIELFNIYNYTPEMISEFQNTKKEMIHEMSKVDNPIYIFEEYKSKFRTQILRIYSENLNLKIQLLKEFMKNIFRDIYKNVDMLYKSIEFVHGDLKMNNILYCNKTKEIRLIDFGFSKTKHNKTKNFIDLVEADDETNAKFEKTNDISFLILSYYFQIEDYTKKSSMCSDLIKIVMYKIVAELFDTSLLIKRNIDRLYIVDNPLKMSLKVDLDEYFK